MTGNGCHRRGHGCSSSDCGWRLGRCLGRGLGRNHGCDCFSRRLSILRSSSWDAQVGTLFTFSTLTARATLAAVAVALALLTRLTVLVPWCASLAVAVQSDLLAVCTALTGCGFGFCKAQLGLLAVAVAGADFAFGTRTTAIAATAAAAFARLAVLAGACVAVVARVFGAGGCFGTGFTTLTTLSAFATTATPVAAIATLIAWTTVRALLLAVAFTCCRCGTGLQTGVSVQRLALSVKAFALCATLAFTTPSAATTTAASFTTTLTTWASAIATGFVVATLTAGFAGLAIAIAVVAAITAFGWFGNRCDDGIDRCRCCIPTK